jgi:hypothetical protein
MNQKPFLKLFNFRFEILAGLAFVRRMLIAQNLIGIRSAFT